MGNNKPSGFTCGDVLLIPDFQEAVVLAGTRGLHRAITRVNVMEVPDVIDWVRPGEFLITSGFPFRDRPDAIADMIPQLAAKGVSALGLKTKRFIDRIPQQALDVADELDFPIFELPASTVFSDVVRDIMERVLVQEARELSLLQSRFQKLSQQLLNGKGIEDFLGELDRMLRNPVILLEGEEHVFLSPQAEEAVRQMGEEPAWDRLWGDRNLGVSFMTIGERRIRVYLSRIDDKHGRNSMLILLEWNQEYTMVDQLTIDRVGILVGLEMINANARKEVEAKYVDQFLQDWLSGRIVAVEDLKLRADACGCPFGAEREMYVGVVRWLTEKPPLKAMQLAVRRLRRRFAERAIHATLMEGMLVLLMTSQHVRVDQAVKGVLDELNEALAEKDCCSLCLGHKVERPDQVHDSYQQARKIHHIASICDLKESCIDYAVLGVYQLLYLLPDAEEVSAFRDRYMLPLLEYGQKHGTMLLDTLRTYFKHNRNAKKTSEELFTHYNTVTYRIERICDILGIDANNGDDMLQLHLAVKLHEMRPSATEGAGVRHNDRLRSG